MVLSLSLHLAVLAFVHPQSGQDGPQTLVINARLQPPPQAVPEALPPKKTDSPAPPAPPLPEPVELPEPPPQQLTVPKPAPIQAEPTPPTPPVQALAQKTEIQAETVAAAPLPVPGAPAMETDRQPAPVTAEPPLALPSPIDTTWYLARQVDRHPKAVGSITPKYPEAARQRNQEGSLKLLVKIDDLGRVRSVEVVEAQPPGMFDEAAMAAFRDARFQPAMKDGRPVRYHAYMRVEFKLE
jgi:protein TonB